MRVEQNNYNPSSSLTKKADEHTPTESSNHTPMSLKCKSKHNLNNPHQESKDDITSTSHEQNFKILELGDSSKRRIQSAVQ
jgi:hypothetical protein